MFELRWVESQPKECPFNENEGILHTIGKDSAFSLHKTFKLQYRTKTQELFYNEEEDMNEVNHVWSDWKDVPVEREE